MTQRLLEAIEPSGRPALPRPGRLPAAHGASRGARRESLIRIGALDGLGVTEAGSSADPRRDARACCPSSRRSSHAKGSPATTSRASRRHRPVPPRTPRTRAAGRSPGVSRPSSSFVASRSPVTRSSSPTARPRAPGRHLGARPARAARRHARDACAGCASVRRRRARARVSGRASSRSRTRPACSTSSSSRTRSNGRATYREAPLLPRRRHAAEQPRARTAPSSRRRAALRRAHADGEPVRLRRGVPSGPMGPSLGGAGAPEEESWESGGRLLGASVGIGIFDVLTLIRGRRPAPSIHG